MNKLTTLLDPISNQIIQLLRINGPMTAGELLKADLNVSRATLYRKMEKMLSLEIVDVSETNIVRGQIEKKYCIKDFVLSEQASNSDRLETVTMGLMNIITQYTNYFSKTDADAERDKLFMLHFCVSLTDEDYCQMIKDMISVIDKYQSKKNSETKPRSLYLLSTPAENSKNKGEEAF